METLFQGAEARIMLKDESTLIKERVPKLYRVGKLDESLRKKRTRSEAKLLCDARCAGVNTPQVFCTDKFSIEMERVSGEKVKDVLYSADKQVIDSIAEAIGESVARLHSFDIIHGDLTTSNFILSNGRLYIIDFGLGFYSKKTEDKAVDLHLLYQALKSTHFNILKDVWEIILKAYVRNYEDANNIIKSLENIRERGRYK